MLQLAAAAAPRPRTLEQRPATEAPEIGAHWAPAIMQLFQRRLLADAGDVEGKHGGDEEVLISAIDWGSKKHRRSAQGAGHCAALPLAAARRLLADTSDVVRECASSVYCLVSCV